MIDLAAEKLRLARAVSVLTGSGISAESGIPTFRGEQGLWKTYRAEELATPEAFRRQPDVVWEWYRYRRKLIRQAAPNPAHLALAELEQEKELFALITQNVDGLHRQAGSVKIFELHGNILQDRCMECGAQREAPPESDTAADLPRCACGSIFRPGVVWFGENLPAGVLEAAMHAAAQSDVFMSIGTSSIVYPAAGLIEVAKSGGAFVIEINPEQTPHTQVADIHFAGAAGAILPKIIRTMKQ